MPEHTEVNKPPQQHTLKTRAHGKTHTIAGPCLAAGMIFALGCTSAHAARPLATDDAGTNEARQCQVEAWSDHGGGEHAWHLAPACGVGAGLEVGWESAQPMPSLAADHDRSVALKWAPEWLSWQGWRFGLKYAAAQGRLPEGDDRAWHLRQSNLTGIASVPLSPHWTIHANLGRTQQHSPAEARTSYAMALAWTPHDQWLLFTEATGDHRSPATRNLGLRWWLIPDVLGLDVTHSVTNATPGSHRSGIGMGWYGIQF